MSTLNTENKNEAEAENPTNFEQILRTQIGQPCDAEMEDADINNKRSNDDMNNISVDNEQASVEEEEEKMLMRQLTKQTSDPSLRPNAASRFTTTMQTVKNDIAMGSLDEKNNSDELFEYAFGEPFSYWKDYKYYPYIAAKYKDLKEELLYNEVKRVLIEGWNEIRYKAEQRHVNIHNILGKCGDTNTPHARYNEQLNKVFGIPFGTLISAQHLMSILFYTNLSELPRCMKAVCRKLTADEKREDFMKRHSELVNWLRLMFETIMLYGNHFGRGQGRRRVYHGLDKKFHFSEFKAKFFTPTSTTTEMSAAQIFAGGNGIIVELGQLESKGDMYFDTTSLSAFPHEKEYLFFFAELPITNIIIGNTRFHMAPLSLYQTIVSGNVMIDRALANKKGQFSRTQKTLNKFLNKIKQEQLQKSDEDEMKNNQTDKPMVDKAVLTYTESDDIKLNEVEQYGYDMLKRYIKNNKTIRINKEEIITKITNTQLRQQFVEQNEDESFKCFSKSFGCFLNLGGVGEDDIKNSKTFMWTNTLNELANFANNDHPLSSVAFKIGKARFYCQMDVVKEHQNHIHGRISLILWKLKGKQKKKTVSFDLYCRQLNKFYIRFHNIEMKLDGEDFEARQGADFDMKWIHKAIEMGKALEWKVTIGE